MAQRVRDQELVDALRTPHSPRHERYEKAAPPTEFKWGGESWMNDPSTVQLCSPQTVGKTCIGLGMVIVLLASAFSLYMPVMISNKIDKTVVTCDAHDLEKQAYIDRYGDCADCTPRYFNVFLFNVTNADAYLRDGAKLHVQEIGPYVYRHREIRVDSQIVGDAIRYKSYTIHKFVPQMSCTGCSDHDVVTSWDVSYLKVIAASGGERGFLRKVVAQLGNGTLFSSDAAIDQAIDSDGAQIMRYLNGMNANDPKVWKLLSPTIMKFLAAGPSAIASLDLSGFAFNGVFAKRSVADWALGYPSMLAGLALGSMNAKCASSKVLDTCAACTGDQCITMQSACAACKAAQNVVEITNSTTCAEIEKRMTAAYGEDDGKAFASATCGTLCATFGVCVASMPGIAESSGRDFTTKGPSSAELAWIIQDTGCSNRSHIGEYKTYLDANATALWAKLDSRRNPTLAELNMFPTYANCIKPFPNVTCSEVTGSDASGQLPGGATIFGFPEKVTQSTISMYLKQAYQNITIANLDKVVTDIDGVKLTRFAPPKDLLTFHPWNEGKGIGYPVDGLIAMGFNKGFPVYISHPMFLYGDPSLLDGIEITMTDGAQVSKSVLYDGDDLKAKYFDRYMTYLDVDPATGKTMRARQRLQANFALAPSQFTPNASMSDILWPNATANVIVPSYIGEEAVTVTNTNVHSLESIISFVKALLPIMVIGILLGSFVMICGCRHRHNHRARRRVPRDVI